MGKPWRPGGSFCEFLQSLPKPLAGWDFREAVERTAGAAAAGRTVLLGMGAHPIKVGLSPMVIDWLRAGILKGVALNGAGVIHDVEMALVGRTSEDVGPELHAGRFGMARETADFIHEAVRRGAGRESVGLGRAVGEALIEAEVPYVEHSILATAAELQIPVTVHVAIGTDIIHMHPSMDGAATGALSHTDFRIFCALVTRLAGGVYINLGSAVILPEVFLKAVAVAFNLGHDLRGLTTVAMDFLRPYRPEVNVVERPTAGIGRGFSFVGHHEILFPLFCAAVRERMHEGGMHADTHSH
ncbi:hypothetical protein [Desulfosoma caldarium]|nr:hypothetical protein [Desulfosoma caldarium]